MANISCNPVSDAGNSAADRYAHMKTSLDFDPPTPLDMHIHWDWTNPLNIVPLIFLLALLAALVQFI